MVGVLCVALSVNHSTESRFPAPTDEKASAGLARFYHQKVTWSRCAPGYCTWVRVPIDYAKPSGATIRLRVKMRLGSGGPTSRKLFVNPGGPGGSGVEFVDALTPQLPNALRSTYDVVGFDPRGVGQSAPLTCLPDDKLEKLLDIDPDPDSDKQISKFRRAYRLLGSGCAADKPDLVGHVSTDEVVRDLDVLRAVMGQRKLDFYGASYGTTIGSRYAAAHPGRVGRMVLDGAVDPTTDRVKAARAQAKGLNLALRSYLRDCVDEPGCPLGTDANFAENQLVALLKQIDEDPVGAAGDRKLTEASAMYGIVAALYDPDSWVALTAAIKRAIYGDGTYLLALADRYFRREPDGAVENNFYESGEAVRCLDDPSSASTDEIGTLQQQFTEVSPVFGRMLAWSLLECAEWPVKGPHPRELSGSDDAPPILVIGTTRDPATPFPAAKALASRLRTGVLVTRHGDGHTGYLMGNQCVDRTVVRFLLGQAPSAGVDCKEPKA